MYCYNNKRSITLQTGTTCVPNSDLIVWPILVVGLVHGYNLELGSLFELLEHMRGSLLLSFPYDLSIIACPFNLCEYIIHSKTPSDIWQLHPIIYHPMPTILLSILIHFTPPHFTTFLYILHIKAGLQSDAKVHSITFLRSLRACSQTRLRSSVMSIQCQFAFIYKCGVIHREWKTVSNGLRLSQTNLILPLTRGNLNEVKRVKTVWLCI